MISYKNITLIYGERKIFERFSCSIEQGEKVLLKGRSGSGKTTLLKMLLGFEKNYDGEIIYDGLSVNDKNIWEIRKRIAYIPQNIDMGEGSVKTWIDSLLMLKSLKHIKNRDNKIKTIFESVGLGDDVFGKNIEMLSGGEKQRVAIAAAFLTGRKVFILDEATSALDQQSKEHIMKMFLENKEYTVIAISHDLIWHNSGLRIFNIGG